MSALFCPNWLTEESGTEGTVMNPMEVDCGTVRARRQAGEQFLFLDCREQSEYDLVHIDGTVLIPMSQLTTRIAELEPYREASIVIHCHHGGRSLRVANWLRQQGFSQAVSLAGGIDQWATEIEPGMARY